ncbi:MAG: hypothetical protein ACK5XR_21110, partial [Pseudanabaena sp.]
SNGRQSNENPRAMDNLHRPQNDWKFGKTVFNVLTLGVVHHGVAFPLVWIMLDKKGNSNTRERCELWNRFL